MTQYARIENDCVVELVDTKGFKLKDLYHADYLKQYTFVECSKDVVPGSKYKNGVFLAPTPVKETELSLEYYAPITLKQLVATLYAESYITEQEVEDWLTKKGLPEFINKLLAALPVETRVDAKITFLTMTTAHRKDPLLKTLVENSESIFGKTITDTEVNAFWLKAREK